MKYLMIALMLAFGTTTFAQEPGGKVADGASSSSETHEVTKKTRKEKIADKKAEARKAAQDKKEEAKKAAAEKRAEAKEKKEEAKTKAAEHKAAAEEKANDAKADAAKKVQGLGN